MEYAWKIVGRTRFDDVEEEHNLAVVTAHDDVQEAQWRARQTLAVLGVPVGEDGILEVELLNVDRIGPVHDG